MCQVKLGEITVHGRKTLRIHEVMRWILGDATSCILYRRGTFHQLTLFTRFVSFQRHLTSSTRKTRRPPPSYRRPRVTGNRVTVIARGTASRNAGGISRHPAPVYTYMGATCPKPPTCRTPNIRRSSTFINWASLSNVPG
jgi:hypothetical protein